MNKNKNKNKKPYTAPAAKSTGNAQNVILGAIHKGCTSSSSRT